MSRFRFISLIFSHFVRKNTSHLSKTVSGLLGRYNYSILDDKTKYFSQSIFHLIKWSRERATKYHAPLGNMVTMAPPPSCPKSCQNMTRMGETLVKKIFSYRLIYCSRPVRISQRQFWTGAKCLLSQSEKRCFAPSETKYCATAKFKTTPKPNLATACVRRT